MMNTSLITKQEGSGKKLVAHFMRSTAVAGALMLALVGLPNISHAAEVTLKAKDGSSEITAELLGFDGERYRLESSIGEILIDAFQVECVGANCPSLDIEETRFLVAGDSDTLDGLFPALLKDFTTGISGGVDFSDANGLRTASLSGSNGENLGKVDLKRGTATAGINDLISKSALLAVSNRSATSAEVDRSRRAGTGALLGGDQQVVLALDGLVIITSSDNPVNAISEANIARVFSGEVSNWAELGGPNAPISVYAREANSGTGASFEDAIMQPRNASVLPSATVLKDDGALSEAVQSDPFAIGYVTYSGLNGARPLAILGSCGIQIPPNPFTLKTEEYPFTNRILMYRQPGEAPAVVSNFVDYLDTEDAQNVIAENNYVDQAVSLMDSADQGRRYGTAMWPTDAEASLAELGNMVQELLPAKRASLTFRFEFGSTKLEARALEDLERLADLLAAGEVFANKELLLVGFTDSIGKGTNNRFLSQQRADQVRSILQSVALPGSLDTTPIRTLGFGEVSPLTCNDTPEGQSVNRRVEVWVRDIVKG